MNQKHLPLAALCAFFFFSAFSCRDEGSHPEGDSICELGGIPTWLNEVTTGITANGHKGEVIRYWYNGQFVYLINGCLDCTDYITVVVDCDKEERCLFGGIAGLNTCPDFYSEASHPKVVWKN